MTAATFTPAARLAYLDGLTEGIRTDVREAAERMDTLSLARRDGSATADELREARADHEDKKATLNAHLADVAALRHQVQTGDRQSERITLEAQIERDWRAVQADLEAVNDGAACAALALLEAQDKRKAAYGAASDAFNRIKMSLDRLFELQGDGGPPSFDGDKQAFDVALEHRRDRAISWLRLHGGDAARVIYKRLPDAITLSLSPGIPRLDHVLERLG